MKEKILEEYQKNITVYNSFKDRVVHLLTDLLSEQEIQIHQISSRNKTVDSLSKKIDDKNEKYNNLVDITDIIGIRIITYLESDVNAISDLIKKEFIVDEKNSIDKRQLKSDQFGYRSLHIVASFNDDRCNLKEYKKYKEIKCEIQIRSILQHAWAEIEHDLGYKGEVSIPEPYKRTFNRLSALLETADIEFDRLKSELTNYEKDIPQLIQNEPEAVDINKTSLKSFINSNEILKKTRQIIESEIKLKLRNIDDLDDNLIKLSKFFNVQSIANLEKLLIDNESLYLDFVKLFSKENLMSDSIAPYQTASLLYFYHYLAGKSEDLSYATNYLKQFFGDNYQGDMPDKFGIKYINLYKDAVKSVKTP